MTNIILTSLPMVQSEPATGEPTNCAVSTGSAPWVVSLVMIRDVAPGTQNIANYIDLFDAVSMEEALGKAIEAVKTRLPDHRLHVYTSMKINVPNDEAEARRQEPTEQP